MKSFIRKILYFLLKTIYGKQKVNTFSFVINNLRESDLYMNRNTNINSRISPKSKVYPKYFVSDTEIDDFTYIAENAKVRLTQIGKFCSIGANLVCGWGIHPTNGISTSPMFYSTQKQTGFSLSDTDKITETLPIIIGNDVFIGMNVTILDGVNIGDGAIIGAGSVVTKNIPPYAIAVGSPIRIIKYRFDDNIIRELLNIKWWDWDYKDLKKVEKYFFDVEEFINKTKLNETLDNNN